MLRYRLLGPFGVDRDGVALELGPPKQRVVLAALAQAAGSVVSVDRLIEASWGDGQPASARASLHTNVSRLRRLLRDGESAPSPIVRRAGGYLLDVSRAELDVVDFGGLVAASAAATTRGDWPEVVESASAALGLWRGRYLADFADEYWVHVVAAALAEQRVGVADDLITGQLGVGNVPDALALSTQQCAEEPTAERTAWLHMTALYRAGRTPEALDAFRRIAARLDELGLEPGSALRELYDSILRQDKDLLAWPKGLAAVVQAAVVPARTVAPIPVDDAPFVGRDAELDIVTRALEAGTSPWVVLAGPAGIGKSRLAREAALLWSARSDGRIVARAQCPDLDERPPWWPVQQLLRELGEDPDAVLANPGTGAGPALDDESADTVSFATVERAVATILGHAASAPLLLIVDDLQWIDASSLHVLSVLAESATGPGLAVLATTRPHVGDRRLERLLDTLARRPGGRRVALSPLAAPDVARLVEAVSGDRPTSRQTSELTDRTGGSPFAIVEYARLPLAKRYGDLTPDAVRTALRRRFEALDDDLHHVLQSAAVLGEPVDARLLAVVTATDETTVIDRLDDAADADLLKPATDGSSYVFAHDLVRAELAAELPAGRRSRIHITAANALAARGESNAVLRRAGHLRAAGPVADPEVAYEAFHAAAEYAEREWMPATAASWWSAVADASLRRAWRPGERADDHDAAVVARASALARAGRGAELLDALDAMLVAAMRAGRATSAGRLAATLLRVSGSWPWPVVHDSFPAALVRTLQGLEHALSDEPAARARVLAVTAVGRCYDPDPTVPEGLSALAIRLAEGTGDPNVLADALLGRALTYAGVASRAVESLEVLTRLSALDHDNAAFDAMLCDNLYTAAQLNLGLVDESDARLASGVLHANVQRSPINRVQLRWYEAALTQWRGDLGRARELYARAEHAHRLSDLQQWGTFALARAVLANDAGTLADAPIQLDDTPMVSRWLGVVVAATAGARGCDEALRAEVARVEPEVWTSHGRLTLLGHCAVDRGLVDLVPPLLTAMTPVRHCLAALGQLGVVGPVAFAMARLARLGGNKDLAREHLDVAMGLAVRSRGAGALLHCRVEAARWALADCDRSDADALRAALSELAGLADEAEVGGRRGLAARARVALSE